MMDWDAGMLGRAGRGGRKAEAVGEGSGTSPFSVVRLSCASISTEICSVAVRNRVHGEP